MDEDVLNTSVSEWVQAFNDANSHSDPGYTVSEIAQECKIGLETARRKVKSLMTKGLCKRGIGIRTTHTGVSYSVPVYDLTAKEQ